MVNSSVTEVTKWLNAFPRKGGISKTLSPRSILTGILVDYNRDCRCEFGQCVQTDEEPDPTNSMEEQATGAICLGSAGNSQGSYRFMSLTTGKVLNRRTWTKIPVANDVIRRVEELAGEDAPEDSIFGNRCGNPLDDNKMAGVVPVIAGVDDDDTDDDNATHDSNTTIQEQEEDNKEINLPANLEQDNNNDENETISVNHNTIQQDKEQVQEQAPRQQVAVKTVEDEDKDQ